MFQLNERTCSEKSRYRSVDFRDDAELIRLRAESVLSGRRLAMMRLYFDRGATCREIAAIAGLSEGHTWRLINSIANRLKDDESLYYLRNRGRFSGTEQKFIAANMFDGLSLRKTAERYGCSVYRVRKAMEKLHTLSRIERSKGA